MRNNDVLTAWLDGGRPLLRFALVLGAVALGTAKRQPGVPFVLCGGVALAVLDALSLAVLVTDARSRWRVTLGLHFGLVELAWLWAWLPGAHALGRALRLGIRGSRSSRDRLADALIVGAALALAADMKEPFALVLAGPILVGTSDPEMRTEVRREAALVWCGSALLGLALLSVMGAPDAHGHWAGWSAAPLAASSAATLATTGLGPPRRAGLVALAAPLAAMAVAGFSIVVLSRWWG